MPGRLEYFGTDPQGKGRGAGWYWHRGYGEYSKFTGRGKLRPKRKKQRR